MRKALPLGALAASAAEGADLVWRTGYYEPLGGIENDLCSAASPAELTSA